MHNDNVQTLSDRILEKEHIIYPRALKKIASEIIKLKNLWNLKRKIQIN